MVSLDFLSLSFFSFSSFGAEESHIPAAPHRRRNPLRKTFFFFFARTHVFLTYIFASLFSWRCFSPLTPRSWSFLALRSPQRDPAPLEEKTTTIWRDFRTLIKKKPWEPMTSIAQQQEQELRVSQKRDGPVGGGSRRIRFPVVQNNTRGSLCFCFFRSSSFRVFYREMF